MCVIVCASGLVCSAYPAAVLTRARRVFYHLQAKVREMTSSHIVHSGLAAFAEGQNATRRPGGIYHPVSADEIPGLKEAGWCGTPVFVRHTCQFQHLTPPRHPRVRRTPMSMRFRLVQPGCGDGTPSSENLHRFMRGIHAMVCEHADGWPFMDPVDGEEARATVSETELQRTHACLTLIVCAGA